ncbi:hypothetical protein Lal_00020098 [Lupinus albus]|uniref:Putative Calmodulin-binding domain, plant n=1 Tax=Lupinus albus TaxID=3870 RepID=A0A6A4Q6P8_LUPAL|nr:putative Calmodulin-binding domain, plant [Lupinus albus]KAF1871306.1 hypothetical protein Lal_00020098 [Lupinus albus]
MATKAKESSVVGKEKKASSSNSPITTTKKTTKPTTTTEKQVPNYLKPTISSRLVESNSFKLTRTNDVSNKQPSLNRRRSFDKPPSPSRLPKQTHPSPPFSRQHKALVSPGPRERSLSLPLKTTNSSKPVPQRLSNTPKEGKTHQPALFAKSDKKSRGPTPSTSTTANKVAKDDSFESTKDTKSSDAETTTEVTNVETETEVKEAIGEKVEAEEVEKQEHEVENKAESEDSPHVESEHEYENEHDHDHEVEESDQSHVQADQDKNLSPTMPEVEAAKEEKNEENENRNQEEFNNINGTIQENDHSTTEEEVEVKEKEEEEEGGEIIEEHKTENKNEEEAVVEEEEEKEGVEGGINEEVNVNKEGEDEEEEVNAEESTESKQQMQHGKKEAQVSNDVIEETASKLLEARKNKVRALAGAFQTVIDHQTN